MADNRPDFIPAAPASADSDFYPSDIAPGGRARQNPSAIADILAKAGPLSFSAPPKFGTPAWFKWKAKQGVGYAADLAPTAGATTGAILGAGTAGAPTAGSGSILGGTVGATIGGAGGKALQQLLYRLLGWQKQLPKTSGEAAEAIGTEGVEQGAIEAVGAGVGRGIKTVTKAPHAPIPLLRSERTGSKSFSVFEHFMERNPSSSGKMAKFREIQNEAVIQKVTDIIDSLHSVAATPSQRGQLIRAALETAQQAEREEFDASYKAIDQLTAGQIKRVPVEREATSSLLDAHGRPMTFTKRILEKQQVGGVQPSTRQLRATAIPILRRIQAQEKLLDPKLLADTKSMLAKLVNTPDTVPYQVMQDTRSDLLALVRKLDDVLPGKRAGIAKKIASVADESMTRAAENFDKANAGRTTLAVQIKATNAAYRNFNERFGSDLVRKLIQDGRVEDASAYLRSASLEDIGYLKRTIKPQEFNTLSSQVMKDVLQESIQSEVEVRKIGGNIPNFKPVPKTFSGTSFDKALNQIGDEKLRALFGYKYSAITNLRALTRRLGGDTSSWVGALHTVHMLAFPATATIGLASGHGIAAISALAADQVFLNAAARVMTNPRGVEALGNYMAATARHAPRLAQASAITLMRIMKSDKEEDEQNAADKVQ